MSGSIVGPIQHSTSAVEPGLLPDIVELDTQARLAPRAAAQSAMTSVDVHVAETKVNLRDEAAIFYPRTKPDSSCIAARVSHLAFQFPTARGLRGVGAKGGGGKH